MTDFHLINTYNVTSTASFNDCVKTVYFVSCVSHFPDVAVRLHQAVGAMDDTVLEGLLGVFVVTSVRVGYSICVAVSGVRVDRFSSDYLLGSIKSTIIIINFYIQAKNILNISFFLI